MAEVIREIPDPWRPYKDGRLWALTPDEMNALPSWQPFTDTTTGTISGLRRIIWATGTGYAVRFTDTSVDIEVLARHGDLYALRGNALWEVIVDQENQRLYGVR